MKKMDDFKRFYHEHLAKYGDTHMGVGWPKAEDVPVRYQVMLDVIKQGPGSVSLLDLGCGTGALLGYIRSQGRHDIHYVGLDNSQQHIALCRQKFPDADFICADIATDASALGEYDYIVACGLFTVKVGLTYTEMFQFMSETLEKLYPHARIAMAFNTMTKHVDWEREDLFHVPLDEMAAYAKARLSRHLVFRAEYGLWEYTTYLFREPQRG